MIRYFRPKIPSSFAGVEVTNDNLEELLDFIKDIAFDPQWTMTPRGLEHFTFSAQTGTYTAFPGSMIVKFNDGKMRILLHQELERFEEVKNVGQVVSLMGSVQPSVPRSENV